MMLQDKISKSLREHTAVLEETFLMQANELVTFSGQVAEIFNRGGRLMVLGSGPLCSIANLVANLFRHRLHIERPALPALSLCQDLPLAASLAKEGRSGAFFAQQLQLIATEGDAVLGLGDVSHNDAVLEGLAEARELGCITAALLPEKGRDPRRRPPFPISADNRFRRARGGNGSVFRASAVRTGRGRTFRHLKIAKPGSVHEAVNSRLDIRSGIRPGVVYDRISRNVATGRKTLCGGGRRACRHA
jgi:D-sedoheptulose 7-phosphate isomerase